MSERLSTKMAGRAARRALEVAPVVAAVALVYWLLREDDFVAFAILVMGLSAARLTTRVRALERSLRDRQNPCGHCCACEAATEDLAGEP